MVEEIKPEVASFALFDFYYKSWVSLFSFFVKVFVLFVLVAVQLHYTITLFELIPMFQAQKNKKDECGK
jgi:hypothetical protein